MSDEVTSNTVELATELTIAWLGNQNNRVSPDDVPAFLRTMHAAINELSVNADNRSKDDPDAAIDFTPAVSVRKSLASKDHILSMIDGKPYRSLRRHLTTNGLTPDEYRARYNLKPDYPMVAPNYSEARRAVAKKLGLGRKKPQASDSPTVDTPTLTPAPTPAPTRRRRKKTEDA